MLDSLWTELADAAANLREATARFDMAREKYIQWQKEGGPPPPSERDALVYEQALEDAAHELTTARRTQWNGDERKVSNWERAGTFVRSMPNPYKEE